MTEQTLINRIVSSVANAGTEIEQYVVAKRIIKEMENLLPTIVDKANDWYTKNNLDGKAEVLGHELRKYTAPTRYDYSDKVIRMEEELKAQKKIEEKTGLAKKKESDPTGKAVFSVKL